MEVEALGCLVSVHMTKNKSHCRKTKRIVRTPAGKFGHLQKRVKRVFKKETPKAKK